ncbi:polysaccharide deacetylase family protein [Sporohalobacter salinus]|uniref:polysaccharide deacetylase family protein n=1 Tax=Sporohalobacter salinus TaxID=1494606 RepID=UPI00195F3436|nr:polysaccharide deacetylase family protein [Sporohalobacter salinus]MBM7624868.1 polysaccharide deacetylase family sporulation protein PdaB [Sporohalobacter salinus]
MLSSNKKLMTLLLILIIVSSVCIPSYASAKYTIQQGDSLFSISNKYNTNIPTLVKLNKIKNPDMIYSGSTLEMPDTINKNSTKNSNTYSSNDWLPGDKIVNTPNKDKKTKKIYRKANTNTMQIALTFDDGPDKLYTPKILKILKKYNVKATFFLLGKQVQKYPQVTKQIINEGHAIGNHTWSHPDLTKLNEEEIKEEILATEKEIKEITDRTTNLIRPPYGTTSDKLLDQLKEMNYKVIHWSIDSLDWNSNNKEEILNRVLSKLKPGSVILFHSSIGKNKSLTPTVQALPHIIKELKKRNIKLVTVNKLLSLAAYKA